MRRRELDKRVRAIVDGWPADAVAHLREHPELVPYVEAGDDGPELAQRRYDDEVAAAWRSLLARGEVVHARIVTRGGMLTTARTGDTLRPPRRVAGER